MNSEQRDNNITFKKHRGGSIRAIVLPLAIILTKVCRAAVSIMAKGLSTGSSYNTQLYSCLCNYNSIVFIL